jgi:hypothetical protein
MDYAALDHEESANQDSLGLFLAANHLVTYWLRRIPPRELDSDPLELM